MKLQVIAWAVVSADGDLVGAYTNRVSAAKRADDLDKDERVQKFGPYRMVRCMGEVEAP